MFALLELVENIADDINTFWFKSDKLVDYQAGQFVELILPHDQPDSRGQKRWFTLSSSPTEQLIGITTRRGSSTFKQTLFGLQVGHKVVVSEPMGDFVLPKNVSIPLVFIAGGVGITPVRSIIKYLNDTSQKRDITIIYATKNANQILYEQLFRDYALNLHLVLTVPNGKECLQIANPGNDALVYVSGPEPMTEKLQKELLAAGILPQNLVLDFFPGYI